jgi:thioredoxin-dependent peroxiredoxin
MIEEGQVAPDFTMLNDRGESLSLSDLKGSNIVLYFYPRDDTPGCTKEANGFRELQTEFARLNTQIIGVSKDSVASHKKFKTKYDLNFTLASDEDSTTCEDYGVWKEKSMWGKKFMAIERTTFLINAEGQIEKVWPKVKVPGHVEAVFEVVKASPSDS